VCPPCGGKGARPTRSPKAGFAVARSRPPRHNLPLPEPSPNLGPSGAAAFSSPPALSWRWASGCSVADNEASLNLERAVRRA
jgi:hypothetical protein